MADPGFTARPEAMDLAMRWLAVRGRSRRQVEERLRAAGFEDTIAEATGRRLEELGVIDDRQFAAFEVESRLRRGYARPYAHAVIEAQGVAAPLVTEVLEDTSSHGTETDRATRVAERWLAVHRPPDRAVAFRRLGGVLARRGFDEDVVWDVCRSLVGEPAEEAAVPTDADAVPTDAAARTDV